jgi:hypothetical protein
VAYAVALMLLLYLLVKRPLLNGCAALLLGYPIYVLFWPVTGLLRLFTPVTKAVDSWIRASQGIRYAVTVYGLVGAAALLLLLGANTAWAGLAAVALVVVLPMILLSLASWLFNPLAWISGPALWVLGLPLKTLARDPLPDPSLAEAAPGKHREQLEKALKAAASGHTQIQRLASADGFPQDGLIAAAFTRKFLATFLTAAVAFGMLHYTLQSVDNGGAYMGLPTGRLLVVWPHYLFAGAMGLLSAQIGAAPTTVGAKMMLLLNTLTGVTMLVVLVAVFSMVTKDRARDLIVAFKAKRETVQRELETALYRGLLTGYTTRSLKPETLRELGSIGQLSELREEEREVWAGVLLMEKLVEDLQRSSSDPAVLGSALASRGRLTEQQLREVAVSVKAAGATVPDAVLRAWLNVTREGA